MQTLAPVPDTDRRLRVLAQPYVSVDRANYSLAPRSACHRAEAAARTGMSPPPCWTPASLACEHRRSLAGELTYTAHSSITPRLRAGACSAGSGTRSTSSSSRCPATTS